MEKHNGQEEQGGMMSCCVRVAAAGGAAATSTCNIPLLLDAGNSEPWTGAANGMEKHSEQKKVVRNSELWGEQWQMPAVLQPPLHAAYHRCMLLTSWTKEAV